MFQMAMAIKKILYATDAKEPVPAEAREILHESAMEGETDGDNEPIND